MAGKAGKSGRKKTTATLAKEALEHNETMIPTYFEILHTIGKNEDGSINRKVVIDTNKYLANRSQGRPKSSLDLRFGEASTFTAEDYARQGFLFDKVWLEQNRLIKELGKDVPLSLVDSNKLVKVQSVVMDLDYNSVTVEFLLPSGLVKTKLT